jgi:RNA polymerase sigma-70 factor (ECF subfamily)
LVDDTSEERRARFEELAGRVYEPLQRYARRRTDPETAADVVADALLVAWRRLDDVPPDRELPWCYGVVRHCLANARRTAARQLRLVERLASQPGEPAAADSADDIALEDALATLKPDDGEVLRLWAWEQLQPREIALVLGTTANAASIRLFKAKRRLAKALAHTGKETVRSGHMTDEHVTEEPA